MSELQKIIPIDPQEISDASIASMAQGNFFQGMSLGGMTAVLFCMASGGPLLALIVGSMFAGAIALKLLKMLSIHNAGQRGDLEKVLSLLPGQQRSELLSVAKQNLNPQPAHSYGQGVTPQHLPTPNHSPAPSNMVTTSAEPVEDTPPCDAPIAVNEPLPSAGEPQAEEPNPFRLDAIAPPPESQPSFNLDSALDFQPIPEEDLAALIGNCPEDEANYLFVGKSRSGKTTFLLNAMQHRFQRNPATGFVILNGKPERDNNWGGLLSLPQYLAVNTEERAQVALKRVVSFQKRLAHWQDSPEPHAPLFIVADEINNQRSLMSDKEAAIYNKYLGLISTQCMSEGCGLWLSSHSPLVTEIGLSRQQQNNFQIVALGRNLKYESIEACLRDEYIIRDEVKRKELRRQFRDYVQGGGNGAIAFTTQGGNARLVRLPHYSKEGIVLVKTQPQSAPTPELQDEPSAEPQPPSVASPLEEWIERLNQYRTENPTATKPEIITAVTGKRPGGSKLYRALQNSWNP